MDTLEQQVRAEKAAAEEKAIAAEVQRRVDAVEAQRIFWEREAERERNRLMRPMEEQSIFGVASTRVKRMVPSAYPIESIELPEQIVNILDEAFSIEDDPILLSKVASTLIRCLHTGEAENRRQARRRGTQYLDERRAGPVVDVPIVLEWAINLEGCEALICGWAIAFRERQEQQETLRNSLEEEEAPIEVAKQAWGSDLQSWLKS